MTESSKTMAFAAAGALSLLAAFALGTSDQQFDVQSQVGERINQFEVGDPKKLRIVKFDPETGARREFEVAEKQGIWSIPSKQGYPADAVEQMAEAATCVVDRTILRVQSESPQDHVELGVVDPLGSKLDSKSQGIGTRVTMIDGKEETLVDMIIGKEVKDSQGQYYVRNANQDVVYVVNLEPGKLSTNFEDWIEDDLLKLNAFDIRKLFLNDYSAELGMALTANGFQMQVSWDRRGEFRFNYDNQEAKWKAEELNQYDRQSQRMVPFELADDEQLNEEALRGLRDALDDLLIVDVERKPKGLSGDLKAGEDFLAKGNQETIESLIDRGFAVVPSQQGKDYEILSSEGEVVCSLRDGVEYVLRFGKLRVDDEGAAAGEAAPNGEQPAGDEASAADAKLNRYLFVMARFNPDLVEKPATEPLPELPEGFVEPASEEPASEQPASEEPAAEDSDPQADSAEVTEEEAEEEEAEEEQQQPAASSDANEATPDGGEEATADTSSDASPDATAEGPSADAPQESAVEDTPSAAQNNESNADANADAATDSDDTQGAAEEEAEDIDALIARRKAIEAENQRKLDEYQETLKKGREQVTELNERFGDWYYVISDSVYKQIHLGRAELIKKKDPPAADDASGAPPAQSNPLSGLPDLPAAP
jgi:hypothetical protein